MITAFIGFLGFIIGSMLTFYFQKRLLAQQLDAQERSHEEMLRFYESALDRLDESLVKIGSNTVRVDRR